MSVEPTAEERPRISFGIIVLNGEPFARYCLRALYPFAHQIVVVEGACEAAAGISTPDAHSRDGTLAVLHQFKKEEDPEDKVVLVTRQGFWPEKHEMSQAYCERATGDYLWQVDIDEFYHPRDIEAVLAMLAGDPSITAVSFRQIQFWGGFDHIVDGWYLRRGGRDFHRLFRWGPGYRYVNHRPPTVVDAQGCDTRDQVWRSAPDMAHEGIFLYHYSLVFPKQVQEKCEYYQRSAWSKRERAPHWAREVFLRLERPYRTHNVYELPGWLDRFAGKHPPQIQALQQDLRNNRHEMEERNQEDVERLLRTRRYRLGRAILKALEPVDRVARKLGRFVLKH
jgi:hypothetical protein